MSSKQSALFFAFAVRWSAKVREIKNSSQGYLWVLDIPGETLQPHSEEVQIQSLKNFGHNLDSNYRQANRVVWQTTWRLRGKRSHTVRSVKDKNIVLLSNENYVSSETRSSARCKWEAVNCSRQRRSSTMEWYLAVTECGTMGLIHGLVKRTQFYVSFIALRSQNEKFVKPWMPSHFSSESRDPSYFGFGRVSRMSHERLASHVLLATPRTSGQEVVQGPGGVITSPTLIGPVLVWSRQNYLRLLLTVRYFESSCPATLPRGKPNMKIAEWINEHCSVNHGATFDIMYIRSNFLT